MQLCNDTLAGALQLWELVEGVSNLLILMHFVELSCYLFKEQLELDHQALPVKKVLERHVANIKLLGEAYTDLDQLVEGVLALVDQIVLLQPVHVLPVLDDLGDLFKELLELVFVDLHLCIEVHEEVLFKPRRMRVPRLAAAGTCQYLNLWLSQHFVEYEVHVVLAALHDCPDSLLAMIREVFSYLAQQGALIRWGRLRLVDCRLLGLLNESLVFLLVLPALVVLLFELSIVLLTIHFTTIHH